MSPSVLDDLVSHYPEVISKLPDRFDSHEFILRLAQDHQCLYVQALQKYAKSEYPFKYLHFLLARHLLAFPEWVVKTGHHNSENIFRGISDAAIWQRVKK
jgi:hypothetical protein